MKTLAPLAILIAMAIATPAFAESIPLPRPRPSAAMMEHAKMLAELYTPEAKSLAEILTPEALKAFYKNFRTT